MTSIVILILLLVGGFAQLVLPGFAVLGQAKFPFLLAVVLYFSLTRKINVMLATAFFAGLLQDALSPVPLGQSIVLFCLLGFGVGRFRQLVLLDSPVTQLFFGFVAGCAMAVGQYGMLRHAGLVVYPLGRLAWRCVGQGLTGGIATWLVFLAAGPLDRMLGNVERHPDIGEIEWSV